MRTTTQNLGPRFRDARSVRPWHDWVHEAVDTIGLIPGLNVPAEIVSGALSLYKRDYVGFGLSVAGLVPVGGELAVAAKLARTASTAVSAARVVHRVGSRMDGAGPARRVSTLRRAVHSGAVRPATIGRPATTGRAARGRADAGRTPCVARPRLCADGDSVGRQRRGPRRPYRHDPMQVGRRCSEYPPVWPL